MKKLAFFLFTALVIFGLTCTYESLAQEKPLSLKEALTYALKHNQSLQKSKLSMEGGRYATEEVKGQIFPEIQGGLGLTDNLAVQKIPVPGSIFGKPSGTVNLSMTPKWNAAAQIQLSQQLFNQSVFIGLKAAKKGEDLYKLSVDFTEEDVLQQVASAYYEILINRENLALLDSSIHALKRIKKVVTTQYKSGLAKNIDLGRISVNISNVENQRLGLLNAIKQQENILKYDMGMPIHTRISVQKFELPQANPSFSLLADTLNQTNLVALKLANTRQGLLRCQKKAKEAAYFPSLSLTGNYAYAGSSNKFDLFKARNGTANWGSMSSLSLNVQIPIFDGFSRRAHVKQADIELQKAQEEAKDMRQSLDLAYENSKLQIKNSLITLQSQEENQRLAEEVYKSIQGTYQNGLSSLTDLLDGWNALIKAQNSYTQALLTYKMAEIQLMKSQGNIKDLLN